LSRLPTSATRSSASKSSSSSAVAATPHTHTHARIHTRQPPHLNAAAPRHSSSNTVSWWRNASFSLDRDTIWNPPGPILVPKADENCVARRSPPTKPPPPHPLSTASPSLQLDIHSTLFNARHP
jgi:hypothetical protein